VPRTKEMIAFLGRLGDARGTVIATGAHVDTVWRGAGNVPEVKTLLASNLNLHDLLKHARLILDRSAITFIEETWGEASEERLRMVRRAA
jgi:large subunit ribosomal protein L4